MNGGSDGEMESDDRSKPGDSNSPHRRTIHVNGESRGVEGGTTVADLVRSMGREPRAVAVELNGVIVPRDRYAFVSLQEGDRLEVVHFVQGG